MFVCAPWVLWLPVSAAILVGSVHLANLWVPPDRRPLEDDEEEDIQSRYRKLRARRPIPVPSLAFALATAFLTAVFAFGGMMAAAAVASQFDSENARFPFLFITAAISFLILSAFLWGYLPCSFKRAMLVAGIHHCAGAVVLPAMVMGGWLLQAAIQGQR